MHSYIDYYPGYYYTCTYARFIKAVVIYCTVWTIVLLFPGLYTVYEDYYISELPYTVYQTTIYCISVLGQCPDVPHGDEEDTSVSEF